MEYTPPLRTGRLIRRYKRFLADVVLDGGDTVTVHCPNTGAMTGCAEPEARVWLWNSQNPKRKYPLTWEWVETAPGQRACIHSARANTLVHEALRNNRLAALSGYRDIRSEARYGREGSRVDLLLTDDKRADCVVEVKAVTLHRGRGLGVFPDAPSERGLKHLRELMHARREGRRAVLVFCAQHSGIRRVAPADRIHPAYGDALREAAARGVEVLAFGVRFGANTLSLAAPLPVDLSEPDQA